MALVEHGSCRDLSPWRAGQSGNKIEDVKTKIVLVLTVAVFGASSRAVSYEAKVQIYDASAAVTTNKGTELMKKGDYEAARQYYDAAIRHDPKEWPAYFDRGILYARQRKWELARQD